jgi:hypothetical protein
MAFRQPYRGNPELKQYYLVNDFSGGVDTVSIDEKMASNTFRVMDNSELSVQGAIEKRKGFGELNLLTQWIQNKSVTIPSGINNFFKIVRSEGQVLNWAHDYETYATFAGQMNSNVYNLQIVFNSQVSTNAVVFYLLTVKNTNGTSGGATVTLTTLLTVFGTIKPTYNIKTIQYVEKIYFLSYDVYNTNDTTKKGICVFNVDDNTLTVLTPQDTYTPTPYEVESFGFNVLRQNPTTDVATQGFGDFSVIGTFLTNTSGQIIDKIPNSGNFDLIAFQIGEQMKHQHVVLTIEDQNETELSYNIEPITDGGGFFTYPIRNLLLTNSTSVTIKFTTNEDIVNGTRLNEVSPPPSFTYTGSYFQFGTMKDFLETKIAATSFKVVSEPFKLTPISGPSFNLSVTVSTGWNLLDVYSSLQSQIPQWYEDPILPTNIRVNDGFGFSYFQATSSGLTRRFFDTAVAASSNFLVKEVFAAPGVTTQETLLKNTSNNYFGYTGGTDFLNDFVTLAQPQDILPFTTSFDIGNTEEVESTDPLDLNGAKITQIQDRLVVYKGNTIYFSEQFQYDYIPNRNFVILPLDATDEITHINFFRGVYIIFTKESIWRISGTIFGDDFLVVKVNDFIGCVAPNSVRALNNNLMFLSRQGLYALTQSYFQEGLENVKRVDDKIKDLVIVDESAYAIMYTNQYWLITPTQTLKYYFDINLGGSLYPFARDVYTVQPTNLEVYNGVIFSLNSGKLFRYDRGYLDFTEPYTFTLRTKNDVLGYPTHDKKFKHMFIKTSSPSRHKLFITVYLENNEVISPYEWVTDTNDTTGEITYTQVPKSLITTGGTRFVVGGSTFQQTDTGLEGNIDYTQTQTSTTLEDYEQFIVGEDYLGGKEIIVHKIVLSQKGKAIGFKIEQNFPGAVSFLDLGILFKLGKVKEG